MEIAISLLVIAFVLIHGHEILNGFPDRRVRVWYRRQLDKVFGV